MSKQLSLFSQEEWCMKVIDSIPEEKKEEAVLAVKELFIAAVEKIASIGGSHGEREN